MSECGSSAKSRKRITEASREEIEDEKVHSVLEGKKKKKILIWFAIQEDDFGFLYPTCPEERNFVVFVCVTMTV